MRQLIYVSVLWLMGLLFLAALTGCSTTGTPALEHCDAYLQRTVKAHVDGGGLVAAGGGEITPDGIVLTIQIVNTSTGKMHTEVVTDTERMGARIVRAGLIAGGVCERGGKSWLIFSGVQSLPKA